jgi:hypothetical protein
MLYHQREKYVWYLYTDGFMARGEVRTYCSLFSGGHFSKCPKCHYIQASSARVTSTSNGACPNNTGTVPTAPTAVLLGHVVSSILGDSTGGSSID